MHRYLIEASLILLLTFPVALRSQVGGIVRSEADGKTLAGAYLRLSGTGIYAETDIDGYFEFTSSPGSADTLFTSYVGFRTDTLVLTAAKQREPLTILLSPATTGLLVEVRDRRQAMERQLRVSTLPMEGDEIERLPTLLGEADVLRSLQLLPGVQSGTEGQTGFYVRGGTPDQNLILLEGIPIYNPNHIFGFFSAFNTGSVSGVEFTTGGFPARYGGRLSSVVDVSLKAGDHKFRKGFSISPLLGSVFVSGPALAGKLNYHIAGRRTYFDLAIAPLIGDDGSGPRERFDYFFGDVTALVKLRLNDYSHLQLTAYLGRDGFDRTLIRDAASLTDRTENRLDWSNDLVGLKYVATPGERLSYSIHLGYSHYDYRTGDLDESVEDGLLSRFGLNYTAGISDLTLRSDFRLELNKLLLLRFGAGYTRRQFQTGTFDRNRLVEADELTPAVDTTIDRGTVANGEAFAYLENIFEPFDGLSLNTGLHLATLDGAYTSLQPRISLRYAIGDRTAVLAGYSIMRQYLHLVTSATIGLPRDLWVPAEASLPPEDASQINLALTRQLRKDWSMTLEAYFKELDNVVQYRPGEGLLTTNDWSRLLVAGEGRSYGLEFLLRRRVGRLNGWAGYTLSWADRQFSELNQGRRFPFRYDKRHNLSLVTSYAVKPDRIIFDANFVFTSGSPVTVTNTEVAIGEANDRIAASWAFNSFESVNNFRIPPTHRLDLSVSFQRKRGDRERRLAFGAYNIYARRNPYFVDIEFESTFNGGYRGRLVKVSLLRIVPSISYSLSW